MINIIFSKLQVTKSDALLSYKNNIFQFITYLGTISIVQVLMVSVVMGQYLDQVNVTGNKMEYTYNYKDVNGSLYSVSSINSDSTNSLGYNYLEFKKYDANFQPILTTYYFDTVSVYSAFYGFEYINGRFYTCGVKSNYSTTDTLKGFILKVDTNGNFIWEKNYYLNNKNVKIGYLTQQNSHIIGLASVYNPGASVQQATKLFYSDTLGNIVWDTTFQGYYQQPSSLRITGENGLIVSTFSNYQVGAINPIIYKLDSLHNIKWSKVLGPSTKDHYLQFLELPNGNYLGVGHSEEPITGYTRSWLVELGKDYGQLVKDTVYWLGIEYSHFNEYSDLLFKNDEIILTASYSASPFNVGQPFHSLIISMSYDYKINWQREYYHRSYADGFYNMYEKDNFYYFQGMVYQDSSTNTNDEWFMVVDSLGCTVQGCSVGITEQELHTQQLSVYPNPSNGSFTIVLDEALTSGEVVITDLSGKQVYSQNTTSATILIDLHQSPGIYLVHLLENGTRIQTEKLILVE